MKISALLLASAALVSADHYAVLVAGSNGYGNYRHQADVCHAYHVLMNNGFPAKNVIVMAYDDIANNSENPYPGKIFNKPTPDGTPGVDVYKGCNIDYKGETVTAANFLKVITGDTSAGGKVLTSTSSDRVFINFVDHGGTGIIAFPSGPFLSADDLNKSLKKMHTTNMYKELVFYMEACESGSMFENQLPADIKIFATTASNAEESSWGTYCPPNDKVNGKELNSCLGDLYSVNWMEDADRQTAGETLQDQFNNVKKATNKSHVMEYGEQDINSEPITNFLGKSGSSTMKQINPLSYMSTRAAKDSSAVDSRDIQLVNKFYKYLRSESDETAASELIKEIESRVIADQQFKLIAQKVVGLGSNYESVMKTHMGLGNFECIKAANNAVFEHCGGFSDYALKHTKVTANLCQVSTQAKIVGAISEVCGSA